MFWVSSYIPLGYCLERLEHFTVLPRVEMIAISILTSGFILFTCLLLKKKKKKVLFSSISLMFSIFYMALKYHLFCLFREHSDHIICPFIFGFLFARSIIKIFSIYFHSSSLYLIFSHWKNSTLPFVLR